VSQDVLAHKDRRRDRTARQKKAERKEEMGWGVPEKRRKLPQNARWLFGGWLKRRA